MDRITDRFGLEFLLNEFKLVREKLPNELSKVTRRHFDRAFQSEGLDNYRWHEVQRRIPGTYAYNHWRNVVTGGRERKILTGETGDLRESVKNSESVVTFNMIKLVADVPYASYHNDPPKSSAGARRGANRTKRKKAVPASVDARIRREGLKVLGASGLPKKPKTKIEERKSGGGRLYWRPFMVQTTKLTGLQIATITKVMNKAIASMDKYIKDANI